MHQRGFNYAAASSKSKLIMKSKNDQLGMLAATTDADDSDPSAEAQEQYDEFNAKVVASTTLIMPSVVTRSTGNKSPLSDEGIEPDAEGRKRGSVSRCWSIDSAVTSEEDFGQSIRRQKLRVTRCCSSDSAVLSDDDQNKGDSVESEPSEGGRPRYWRTPSVVVSDYSDYSYFDERFERSDSELEKLEGNSASASQASSCSCLDCDEIREFRDISSDHQHELMQVCRHRRHSDSCCLCLAPNKLNLSSKNINDGGNRRNSCLASPNPYYTKLSAAAGCEEPTTTTTTATSEEKEKTTICELLDIPPTRKISDCSTISSLSGDEFEVTELQPVRRIQIVLPSGGENRNYLV
ncbi:uncharacterized protein LOC116417260 isoform X2 [Nasonia vitripennis]|uniref:Uncharacterized protein n=2 Tax=Nasonia vitripennis TaxID=7425 RepID=A0A7M7QCE0_NASVI|nr:uncharacterized protein LOC116417260 isoform X2 [Nasonia vitripennis]